jgi:gluconate 5-dehydrogenase
MNNQLFDISNKLALITGSSKGIGKSLAYGLASSGARVVINGRDQKKIADTVKELKEYGMDVYSSAFDVNDKPSVEVQIEKIENELGSIDILINNAGIQIRGALEDFELDSWQKILDVNLTGVFIVSQCVVRKMIKRKSGKIINICSLQSDLARPTIAPYAASKGGVRMLTRAMSAEWAKYNIQINGIGPGYFETDMTKPLVQNEDFDAWIKKRTPAGRWGDVSELTGTAIFLSSKASDFINGQLIYVDGGLSTTI